MTEPATTEFVKRVPGFRRSRLASWEWVILISLSVTFLAAFGHSRFHSVGEVREPLPPSITAREYQVAAESFELKYRRKPDQLDVLSWLVEWYLGHDLLPLAVDCFAAIPTTHPQYGRMARYLQGRTLLELNRAVESEQQLRELIFLEETSPTIKPQFLVDARQRLRHLLEVSLRFEERQQLLRGVVARGEADHFELLVFCFPSHLRWNGPTAVRWLERF